MRMLRWGGGNDIFIHRVQCATEEAAASLASHPKWGAHVRRLMADRDTALAQREAYEGHESEITLAIAERDLARFVTQRMGER